MDDDPPLPQRGGDGAGPAAGRASVPRWLAGLAAVSWRFVVICIAAWIIVWAISQVPLVVISLLIACLAAAVLAPPVERLERLGLRRGVATLVVILAAMGLFAAALSLIGMRLVREAPQFADQVTTALAELQRLLPGIQSGDFRTIAQELQQRADPLLGTVLSTVRRIAGLITGLVLVLVLTFFMIRDGRGLWGWVLDRLQPSLRGDVDVAGRAAWATLSLYVRGLLVVATIDAVGVAVGLMLIGVPLVLTLATLTFLGGFIPLIGALAAGLAAVTVAFVSGGVTEALLTLAVVVVVQQVEGNILAPAIYGSALPLHPGVVLVVLTAGGLLAGLAGAFLAVPVAAAASGAGHALRLHHERRGASTPQVAGARSRS